MSTIETLDARSRGIVEEAIAQAQAAISAYEDAEMDLDAAVAGVCDAFEDGWEGLYTGERPQGLLALTTAWKGLLDQLLTPKDRDELWFSPHAANFHWRHGRALMDPALYLEAEKEFNEALSAYQRAFTPGTVGPQFLMRLHEWRGFCRANQGKLADARADFLTLFDLQTSADSKAQTLRTLASLDLRLGDRAAALGRLEQGMQLINGNTPNDLAVRELLQRGLEELRAAL